MGVLTLVKPRRQREDFDYVLREPLPIVYGVVMALIFLAALALRYWANFVAPHVNAYGSGDASEYLRNAGAFIGLVKLPVSFWNDAWSVLSNHATPNVVARLKSELAPLQELHISGPVFPLFIAWCYALALSPFSLTNWAPPVSGQCLISAFTCLFIGLTASRAFGKPAGILAALTAAVYPAFLINAGRLYSETFATFLLSVICYLTVRGFTTEEDIGDFCRCTFIEGIAAACLQFTRSIMVLVSVALVPIVAFQQGTRKGVAGICTLLLGFALVAIPWVALQKLAFGSASLVVDRVGHYNFFVGNNTDTWGWLSVPYPDGRGIDEKPMPQLAQEAYRKSPGRWWSLLLDKPLRLLSFPWNDFRTPIQDFTFHAQVIFHQAILLFAAIGMVLSFAPQAESRGDDGYDIHGRGRRTAGGTTAARLFLLFVCALHLAYLFFITVPRYNLTLMPELIMFGAAGLVALMTLPRLHNGVSAAVMLWSAALFVFVVPRLPLVNVAATLTGPDHATAGLVLGKVFSVLSLLAICVALWTAINAYSHRESGGRRHEPVGARALLVALGIAVLPLFALQANASGRWYEWKAPLTRKDQTITQTFSLPADFGKRTAGRQLYLMVDAGSAAQLAAVNLTVDGVKLDGPPIPAIAFIDESPRYQSTRHGSMREIEWVFDSLTEAAGIKSGDLRQWFLYPIPHSLLAGKQATKVQIINSSGYPATIYGGYPTSSTAIQMPSETLCSWEKAFYGVENDEGLSDPRYNTRLNSLAATSYDMDLSSEPGVQSGRYNIHILASPPLSPANDDVYTVERVQPITEAQAIASAPVAVTTVADEHPRLSTALGEMPPFAKDDRWLVRISGEVHRNAGTAKLSSMVTISGSAGNAYASPWSSMTPVATQWRRFDFAAPVQPGMLPFQPEKVSIDLDVIGAKVPSAAGLSVQGLTEFRNVSLQVIRLPNNPLHPGHFVI